MKAAVLVAVFSSLTLNAVANSPARAVPSVVPSAGQPASLLGERGSFSIRYGQKSSLFVGPTSFTVGAGQEAKLVGGNVVWLLDISDATVNLSFNDSGCCTDTVPFSGPVISFDFPSYLSISGVNVTTNTIVNFDTASRVSFDRNSIAVDVSDGVDLGGNRQLSLGVALADARQVPAPPAWIGSLAALWYGRRCRRGRKTPPAGT